MDPELLEQRFESAQKPSCHGGWIYCSPRCAGCKDEMDCRLETKGG